MSCAFGSLSVIISDCVSPAWRNGTITKALAAWAKTSPTTIIQVLPEWLWERSALGVTDSILLRSLAPGVPNQQLIMTALDLLDESDVVKKLKVPVVTLEPESLRNWAWMVAGAGDVQTKGFLLALDAEVFDIDDESTENNNVELSAKQRLQRFRLTASPMARKLAGLLAAAPVSLPVVRLVRQTMLPKSSQVHVAEVLLGGILKPLSPINEGVDADKIQYDFVDGVRDLLLDAVPLTESTEVLRKVSEYVAQRAGLSVDDFAAILVNPGLVHDSSGVLVRPFAQVTAKVLRRLGGKYAEVAQNLEKSFQSFSQSNVARAKPFQPPPTPEYYVDRPEVILDLKQLLLSYSGTLVITVIHGLGSVGKSTLAAALAHDADIQKHFCDGILWATLGQEPDILALLGGWVQGLGDYNYRATSIEATSAHLNTLLFDKALLLVVDDAWIDENDGWEPVQAFKVGGDRTRMLVTTRDASIANFLGASTFSLDVMTKTQALELLTKKVEQQGKRLQEDEVKSAKALAKAVGYLPLALELAASQVASGTSWQVLIEDIEQEIARLKSFQEPGIRNITNDEKFKKFSLQASLNLSIKRLEENDREFFAWLGVLPEDASITPKITATLWDMDERDAEETLQYLRSQALLLTGVFLADGTVTYRLHDLFHDLARNLLTAPQKPKRQGDLVGFGIKWEDAQAQLLDKLAIEGK